MKKRPNLLYVFLDQWRYQAMGYAKSDEVCTPHMDSFARESLDCTEAVSTFPLCSPHRASLLTGKYPFSVGMWTNCKIGLSEVLMLKPQETCIGNVLKDTGYHTGYIGKWHLDASEQNFEKNPVSGASHWDAYTPPGERRQGFDYWLSYGACDEHLNPHYWADTPEQIKPGCWSPEFETDKALEYMEEKKNQAEPFVGESGCGKTTLLKIIAGLNRPQKGEAFVLGYDLFQCRPEQLYCHLALVLQDTYLFPGTIRENLIAGNRNISLEQLENACKKAKIWEWICKLPKGLDTTLSEFSSNISGGQKQRIGIARAILRKADVWLIDEPTSSLDYQTAQDILNNLRDITRTYTTVTVTHDMSNMSEYDFILVMEDGKLVQTGTHFELLKKEGVYAKLYEKERNE